MKFNCMLSLSILGSTSPVAWSSPTESVQLLTERQLLGGTCIDQYSGTLTSGTCNWEALKGGMQTQINNRYSYYPQCRGTKPEDEFRAIIGNQTMTDESIAIHVNKICADAFKEMSYYKGLTLNQIFGDEEGDPREFFNGRGPINSRRETSATKFGQQVDSLQSGTGLKLKSIQDNYNTKYPFAWPGEGSESPIPNFDQCNFNTVMCCWSQDRQVDTSTTRYGTCQAPYDKNCRDADPTDNTDICLVNMADSPSSAHGKQFGFSIFPGDDTSQGGVTSEGAMYCNGFAWADDDSDLSKIYRANNLFDMALYGVYERGYVSPVPGAPQCGCLEQMPVVSRSDCSEVNAQNFRITYTLDNGKLNMELKSTTVAFNPCKGEKANNDLQEHYNKLVKDGKVKDQKKALSHRLVGRGGCPQAIDQFFVKLFIGESESTNAGEGAE